MSARIFLLATVFAGVLAFVSASPVDSFIEAVTEADADAEFEVEVEIETDSQSEITVDSQEVFQHLALLNATRASLSDVLTRNGLTVEHYNKILQKAKRNGAQTGGALSQRGFFEWLDDIVDSVSAMLDKLNVVKWWECNRCGKCVKLVRGFQKKVVDFFLGDLFKIRDQFLAEHKAIITDVRDLWVQTQQALELRKKLVSAVVRKAGEFGAAPVCAATVTTVAAILCGAITAPIPIPGSTLLICTPFLSWVQSKCEGFMGKAIQWIFEKITATSFLELSAGATESTTYPGISEIAGKMLDGSFTVDDLDNVPYIGSKTLCENVGLCPTEREDCTGDGALFSIKHWETLTAGQIVKMQEDLAKAAEEAATKLSFPAPDCFKRNLYTKGGSLIHKQVYIRGIGDCRYPSTFGTCDWDAECNPVDNILAGQKYGCAKSDGTPGYCGCVNGFTSECTCLQLAPADYKCQYNTRSETGWLWYPTERSKKKDDDQLRFDDGEVMSFFSQALSHSSHSHTRKQLLRRMGQRVEWKMGTTALSPAEDALRARDAIPATKWSYQDVAAWEKTWPNCGSKERPSPIPVATATGAAPATAFRIDTWYPLLKTKGLVIQNDGRKVFFKAPAGFKIRLHNVARTGDADISLMYELVTVEFHSKSEHTWAGKQINGEMHLIHKLVGAVDRKMKTVPTPKTAEDIVVLAWGFSQHHGGHRKLFTSLQWDKLPAVGLSHTVTVEANLKLGKVLHQSERFPITNYLGTLTSPPCSNAEYYVFEKTGAMGDDTVAALQKVLGGANARPVQQPGSKSGVVRSAVHAKKTASGAKAPAVPAKAAEVLKGVADSVKLYKKL